MRQNLTLTHGNYFTFKFYHMKSLHCGSLIVFAHSILSLSDLDNGVYFVYLELEGIILSTEKLIIQR